MSLLRHRRFCHPGNRAGFDSLGSMAVGMQPVIQGEVTMNASIAQCRHLLSQAEPILAGLDDSHRALEPHPGAKTAGWLIGHLSVTGDFARRLCGRAPLCPTDWRALFNPGSRPAT